MLRVLLFVVLACVTSSAFAEQLYYIGTLGDARIQMELVLDEAGAEGYYTYDTVGVPLDLSGTIDREGIELEAHTRPDTTLGRQLTGTFRGELSAEPGNYGANLSGTWTGTEGETLTFDLRRVAEYAQFSLEQGLIAVGANYPVLEPPFADLGAGLQNDILSSLIDFALEGQRSARDGELFGAWTLQRDLNIRYASAELVSITETLSVYTGGAHPNHGLASYTYVATDSGARALKLADFFRPGADYLAVLSPYVLEALRNQDAQWVVDGAVDGLTKDDLAIVSVFLGGLEFGFEPYAVGPYAQGPFFVTIPFDVLRSIIEKDGPLAIFID